MRKTPPAHPDPSSRESTHTGSATGAANREVFIARQPILDATQRVIGYELLFRSSETALAFSGSPEEATARVITDAVCTFGLDVVTNGKLGFINLTRQALLQGIPAGLPPTRVVLELLEGIEADPEVMTAVRALAHEGYTIALDDFVPSPANMELVAYADFIKMGFKATPDAAAWIRSVTAGRRDGLRGLVAEQIETHDDFHAARDAGLTYFQGFFFGRPATQRAREIPHAQIGYLRLLQALRDPDLAITALEALIKPDAALCYRVLRTVNSAGFGAQAEISSIREALVMLGREPIRRWVSIWAMASVAKGSHSELLITSIVRARMCELLAGGAWGETQAAEGFLLGLCSQLDAVFDAPMAVVVAKLPLAEPVRAALVGDDNRARRLLDAVVAYERGDWANWQRFALDAGLDANAFAAASADALKWAREAHRSGATGDSAA